MAVLQGDIEEGKTRVLAYEHTASSFRDKTKAVECESIYKGQAHNVHVLYTVCYRKVPVTNQKLSRHCGASGRVTKGIFSEKQRQQDGARGDLIALSTPVPVSRSF